MDSLNLEDDWYKNTPKHEHFNDTSKEEYQKFNDILIESEDMAKRLLRLIAIHRLDSGPAAMACGMAAAWELNKLRSGGPLNEGDFYEVVEKFIRSLRSQLKDFNSSE